MIKTIKSDVVYKNNWISVEKDQVLFPDGSIGEYGVVRHHSKSVVVLVKLAEKILLVQAYRYVNQSYSLELPAGVIEEGESPIEAARREVMEETGLLIHDCNVLTHYYPSNGVSDQVIYVVMAKCNNMDSCPDNNEIDEIIYMTESEISNKIIDNTINDGPSILAWSYYVLARSMETI